jgi:hypothetical protein
MKMRLFSEHQKKNQKLMKSNDNFDAKKLLSPELVINSAGNHFYSYGISLFEFKPKRRKKLIIH